MTSVNLEDSTHIFHDWGWMDYDCQLIAACIFMGSCCRAYACFNLASWIAISVPLTSYCNVVAQQGTTWYVSEGGIAI